MKKELAQKYDHHVVEQGKYEYWGKNKVFFADEKSNKPSFTIVIPPPNVTGKLHLGHAWDTTIQDLIIRLKRMQGYNALYLPGMDHAGIATQAKVEARLREDGVLRQDLGREQFLAKVWAWKEEYAASIREQWAKLGLSLDYSKERFTLDAGLSDAVTKVFVDLYNKGIIYRGHRIINWDPVQQTALSNIEVMYEDIPGYEHYFKYMFADGSGAYLTIMTTRPETMFGDGAIAVHPDDERYKDIVGKEVIVPSTGVKIPIIADTYVDMTKGSGAVKITPAHDPNDFEVGLRHHIPQEIIMNPDGTMADTPRVPQKYRGLDRFVAREQYVKDLQAANLVIALKPIVHAVGHSERSGAIVEPYLSQQWFVKMADLAQNTIDAQAVAKTHVDFYPERFEKVFLHWMENVQDWCISRQLWWGHQIPAWYHKETGEIYVGLKPPHDLVNWQQDEDVLDTWFSSALWPFSTLGWPDEAAELYKKFFPTDVLVTGYDIIFFWVSRMIFQSLAFTGQRPFHDVLIHGLIRDSEGRKMSKSLGNGVDPMEVIDKYGADSLRYFLVTNTAPGQDLRYSEKKVLAASNFANKIWNAAKFVLMHSANANPQFDSDEFDDVDQWMLHKLNQAIENIDYNAAKYEFGEVGRTLYNFIWDDFCNWYIELTKPILFNGKPKKQKHKQQMLLFMLNHIVRLLHPFMPFITEEIWQALPGTSKSISVSPYPQVISDIHIDADAVKSVTLMMEAIVGVRQIRADYQVSPAKALPVVLECADSKTVKLFNMERSYLAYFMRTDQLVITDEKQNIENAERKVFANFTLIVRFHHLIDVNEQKKKLATEEERLIAEVARFEKMMANRGFVQKAPEDKVAEIQEKLTNYREQLTRVRQQLKELK